MKLNDEQLEYLRDEWRIPIRLMRPLDAYRRWVIDSWSDYYLAVVLCDSEGYVQYSIPTDGDLPGEDSLPLMPDEYGYGRSDYYS